MGLRDYRDYEDYGTKLADGRWELGGRGKLKFGKAESHHRMGRSRN